MHPKYSLIQGNAFVEKKILLPYLVVWRLICQIIDFTERLARLSWLQRTGMQGLKSVDTRQPVSKAQEVVFRHRLECQVDFFHRCKALSTWPEKSLREAWESHERMGSPGQLSHEILRLLSGHVDKAQYCQTIGVWRSFSISRKYSILTLVYRS